MSSRSAVRRVELTGSGHSWYAAAREEMSLSCRAKLEFVDLLSKWKSQLGCGSWIGDG